MPQQFAQWPLNLCQYGPEVTPGAAVSCTGIWRGPFGGFEDDNKQDEIEEDVGTFAKTRQSFITWNGVNIPFPAATLNLYQLPIILQASMGKVTATGTGPYVRTYNAATGDVDPVLQPYTLRVGNKRATSDIQAAAFSLVQEWELSGKQGEMWEISGRWIAPRRVSAPFTNSVPLPAFDPFIFAKTKLYIDDSGGVWGTTQKTGVLLAASIKWKTNIEWIPVGDGFLFATAYKLGRPQVDFSLTLELEQDGANSVVATERSKYDTNATRLIRWALSSNGGSPVELDLAGAYDKVSAYGKEGDTNTAVTFEGRGLYNATEAQMFSVKHTSPMASIP